MTDPFSQCTLSVTKEDFDLINKNGMGVLLYHFLLPNLPVGEKQQLEYNPSSSQGKKRRRLLDIIITGIVPTDKHQVFNVSVIVNDRLIEMTPGSQD